MKSRLVRIPIWEFQPEIAKNDLQRRMKKTIALFVNRILEMVLTLKLVKSMLVFFFNLGSVGYVYLNSKRSE